MCKVDGELSTGNCEGRIIGHWGPLISVPSRQFARMMLHQTGDIKTRNLVALIMQDVLYLESREDIPKERDKTRVSELR